MRAPLVAAALLALAGCKGLGLSNLDTGGYATPTGLSHLDTHSPDAEDDKWLKSYYGSGHGWGWDPPKEQSPNCGFWGTCGGGGGASSDSYYGRGDNSHNNSVSDW